MTISFKVRGTFPSPKACLDRPFAQVARKQKRGGGPLETHHRVSGLVQHLLWKFTLNARLLFFKRSWLNKF